jgi:GNAT superfamily N-acetyltransferase
VAIRDARRHERAAFGELLVTVYSSLEGFPSRSEQPRYYELLADVGSLAQKPGASVLVAVSPDERVMGGVVYFGDMTHYGSAGSATSFTDASGIRLLAVSPQHQAAGIGTMLAYACIDKARLRKHTQVILHTTRAMEVAWRLYEKLGFRRSEDLDFMQAAMPVYGFRLRLTGREDRGLPGA